MRKERLFYCNANVIVEWNEKENGYNYNLVSYSTKICTVVIDYDDEGRENITVKLWRYQSNTSQKHIRKFAKWLMLNISDGIAGVIVDKLQTYLVKEQYNYGTYDGIFHVYDLNREQLKERGFQYGYSDL